MKTVKLSHTEKTGISIKRVEINSPSLGRPVYNYRHCDKDGVVVGPSYSTLQKAIEDTNSYVVRAGWLVD